MIASSDDFNDGDEPPRSVGCVQTLDAKRQLPGDRQRETGFRVAKVMGLVVVDHELSEQAPVFLKRNK